MKNAIIAIAIMFSAACLTQPDDTSASTQSLEGTTDGLPIPPLCSTLGCPLKPSGSPFIWEPCPDDKTICYCGSPAQRCFNDRAL